MALGPWRTAYNALLEQFSNPAFIKFGQYSVAGRSFTYRSLDEARKLLDYFKQQAVVEDGTITYRARTHAINGGRGY